MTFRFGRVSVEIRSGHPAGDLLIEEFGPIVGKAEDPDVVLNVLPYPEEDLTAGKKAGERTYRTGDGRTVMDLREPHVLGDANFIIAWRGDPSDEGTFEVTAFCDPRYGSRLFPAVTSRIRKQTDWNYIDPAERVAKNLTYNLLEPFLQIRMLNAGQTFMHAGAVANDDGCIIFTGEGGTGKTGTTMRLILDHGFRFMSDDLMVVDDAANAYMYPKSIQVYAYNIADFEELEERLFEGRGPLDRFNWERFLRNKGEKGVRRRVPPPDLLGEERIGPLRTGIRTVYYLRSVKGGSVRISDADVGEMARLSRDVIREEMRSVFDHIETMEDPPVDLDAALDRTEELYRKIFSKTECRTIDVPKGTDPKDICRAVLSDL